MSHGIVVRQVLPNASSLKRFVENFARKGGMITSTSDSVLSLIHEWVDDELETEVSSFGGFLSKVLRVCGVANPPMLTSIEHHAITRASAMKLESDTILEPIKELPGLIKASAEALRDLRHWRITPNHLNFAASTRQDKWEKSSLESLAILLQYHDEFSEGMVRSTATSMTDLIGKCDLKDQNAIKRVLVYAPADLWPDRIEALQALSVQGIEVTLLLEDLGDEPSLSKIMARHYGLVADPKDHQSSWIHHIFKDEISSVTEPIQLSIFEDDLPVVPRNPLENIVLPEMLLLETADSLSEAEWALRTAQSLTEKGIREDQIVIYCTQGSESIPLLLSASERFGMELEARINQPVRSNGFIFAIDCLLKSLSLAQPIGLCDALDSSYFEIGANYSRQLRDQVRNLVNQNLLSWDNLFEWIASSNEPPAILTELQVWKSELSETACPLRVWIQHCKDLFELDAIATSAQNPDSPKKIADRRAVDAAVHALASYEAPLAVIGGTDLTFSEFCSLCHRIWDEATMVRPSPRDRIQVVTSPLEIREAKAVIALGLVEGSMPRRRSEHPILGDELREILSNLTKQRPKMVNSELQAMNQRTDFLRLCAAAKEQLILCYSRGAGEASASVSSYVSRLRKRFGDHIQFRRIPIRQITPALNDCRFYADEKLFKALHSLENLPLSFRIESQKVRDMAVPNLKEGVKLRAYQYAPFCAFRSVFGEINGIKPVRSRTARLGLFGIPQKSGFFLAETEEEMIQLMRQSVETFIKEEYGLSSESEVALTKHSAERYIRGWVNNELAFRATYEGELETKTNVSFSAPPLRNTLQDKETDVTVKILGEFPMIRKIGNQHFVQRFKHKTTFTPPITDTDMSAIEMSEHEDFGHFDTFEATIKDEPELFRILIESQILYNLHPFAFFYDMGSKEAVLVRPIPGFKKKTQPGIKHKNFSVFVEEAVGDSIRVGLHPFFKRTLRDYKRRANMRLLSGSASVTPNPKICERCPLSEFCRRPLGADGIPFSGGENE